MKLRQEILYLGLESLSKWSLSFLWSLVQTKSGTKNGFRRDLIGGKSKEYLRIVSNCITCQMKSSHITLKELLILCISFHMVLRNLKELLIEQILIWALIQKIKVILIYLQML